MHKRHYILFDLDGTLSDPGEGIINSLLYSLKHFQIEGNSAVLAKFIGPPLIDSFRKYYHFDEKQARRQLPCTANIFTNTAFLPTKSTRAFHNCWPT